MSYLQRHRHISVVTAILPQHVAGHVIDTVFAAGDRNTLLVNARGTLRRERWYQALLPMMSPEKEYLQFLVPDREVEHILEAIVTAGELHIPAAGAVFAIPCDDFAATADFELWTSADWEADPGPAQRTLRENLTAIYCVLRRDQTDQISRAAMNAGAHGPIVCFCEGTGLRGRLGWLRITRKHDKEMLLVVVDNADAVAVSDAMVAAGGIDAPGRGFLFRMPIQSGLINIGSTFGNQRYAASIQQIIAAIDDIKGGPQWRDRRVNELIGAGKSAGLNLFGKVRTRAYLSGQCNLSCLVGRRHSDAVVSAALAAGAPGANLSYGKLIEAGSRATAAGIRLNRERALIRMILPESSRVRVAAAIEACCAANDIHEFCMYSQPVTRAVTYIPDTRLAPEGAAGLANAGVVGG